MSGGPVLVGVNKKIELRSDWLAPVLVPSRVARVMGRSGREKNPP